MIFKNVLLQSIQLEIPLKINSKQLFKTNLLFFYDYAIGGDKYNQLNNKLKGHGLGISMFNNEKSKFDICIGINSKGEKRIHFISNIN